MSCKSESVNAAYLKIWRHKAKRRRWWPKRMEEKWGIVTPLVVVGMEVVAFVMLVVTAVTTVAGDKSGPSILVRKDWKWLSFSKVFMLARFLLLEVFSNGSTTAWNQEPSCLHMSGPPESPWNREKTYHPLNILTQPFKPSYQPLWLTEKTF